MNETNINRLAKAAQAVDETARAHHLASNELFQAEHEVSKEERAEAIKRYNEWRETWGQVKP